MRVLKRFTADETNLTINKLHSLHQFPVYQVRSLKIDVQIKLLKLILAVSNVPYVIFSLLYQVRCYDIFLRLSKVVYHMMMEITSIYLFGKSFSLTLN